MKRPLFLTLADDSWQRAHYAMVVSAGALSLGRPVTIFAGGRSVLAFAQDWSRMADVITDDALEAQGVAGFGELRAAVQELGARFMACEAGLKMAQIDLNACIEGVSARGIVSFLELVGDNPLLAL